MKQSITSNGAPAPIGPYSQAVRAGSLLFVSGQTAQLVEGAILAEGIEAQTKQVLDSIENILKEAGLSWAHVVRTDIFLNDLHHFKAVNALYAARLAPPYPARQTVEVSRLPRGALIEISCIAHFDS